MDASILAAHAEGGAVKLWKKIVLGILLSIAFLLAVALFLPSKWHMERSITVAAMLEKQLGEHFDIGLKNLKNVAESTAQAK